MELRINKKSDNLVEAYVGMSENHCVDWGCGCKTFYLVIFSVWGFYLQHFENIVFDTSSKILRIMEGK